MVTSLNVNSTVGAIEIGFNISAVLFGCETLQMYIYYHRYPKDQRGLKYFVAFIWILELCHHITLSHAVYIVTVTEWGNPSAFLVQPSSINASIFISICVVPIVESFYRFRIYKFSGKVYPALIGVIAIWIKYPGWLVFTIQEYKLGFGSEKLIEGWSWLLIFLLSLSVVVDGVIAATMAYYLFRWRDSGLTRTTKLVD